MEGTVIHYDEATMKGIVRNSSGDRFEFNRDDWKSTGVPRPGATVDFLAEDKLASEIYVLKASNPSANVADKLSNFQQSDVGQGITALFGNGMHNRLGFLASLAVLLSLFFPIIQIPFVGSVAFISTGIGKLLFMMLAVLAIFFYGGATKLYTKILASAVLVLLFFQYYDLFSGLNQANNAFGAFAGTGVNSPNFFSIVTWGAYVNIAACVALFLAAYIKDYSSNEEAI